MCTWWTSRLLFSVQGWCLTVVTASSSSWWNLHLKPVIWTDRGLVSSLWMCNSHSQNPSTTCVEAQHFSIFAISLNIITHKCHKQKGCSSFLISFWDRTAFPGLNQKTITCRSPLKSYHSLRNLDRFISPGNLESLNLSQKIRATNNRLWLHCFFLSCVICSNSIKPDVTCPAVYWLRIITTKTEISEVLLSCLNKNSSINAWQEVSH